MVSGSVFQLIDRVRDLFVFLTSVSVIKVGDSH